MVYTNENDLRRKQMICNAIANDDKTEWKKSEEQQLYFSLKLYVYSEKLCRNLWM